MSLVEGQVFAGYTIGRILGLGGMGEVYLAQHPRLPRRDALKVLGDNVSHDDEYRQRFNQEAEMVSTLSHPNIVTIYDRGDCDGHLWIAMEFVDGIDAGRLLNERHPRGVPPDEVARIVTAVAGALDYAHSRGLLHRDIKPANILLDASDASAADRILLADFGVARRVGQTSTLTGIDMTVGTVTYAAPEQLKGDAIDGRADQYALAATAYHLLTGTAPFTNTNPAVVIGKHLSELPPDIGTARPELARLAPVFARALAKDPGERFDRCADFAAAFEQALSPAPPPARRRWGAAGLGVLMLAGAAAAAVALLAPHRGADVVPTPVPAPTTTPPPPAVSARMDLPVVVMGADCAVLGAAAVDEAGAPAYCARSDADPSTTVWSVKPERLRTSVPAPPP